MGFLSRNWGDRQALPCATSPSWKPVSRRPQWVRGWHSSSWEVAQASLLSPPRQQHSRAGGPDLAGRTGRKGAEGSSLSGPAEPAEGRGVACCSGHLGAGMGIVCTYLALVKFIHGLHEPIMVIHPHHPGKAGDEASIAWEGRRRSESPPRSPTFPWAPRAVRSGPLFHPKRCWWGRGGARALARPVTSVRVPRPAWALAALGGGRVGCPPARGLAALGGCWLSPSLGPGTHLRWPCVGSGWGGPAAAARGACPRLGSPAGALGAGTYPACSGTAESRREVTTPAPTWAWLG